MMSRAEDNQELIIEDLQNRLYRIKDKTGVDLTIEVNHVEGDEEDDFFYDLIDISGDYHITRHGLRELKEAIEELEDFIAVLYKNKAIE